MRKELDAGRVLKLLEAIGRAARGPGRIYLTGGTTAVLQGWRQATVDADLKLDPEPSGVFAAIARIKDDLEVNIELAAPDDFIPPLPGWRDRSIFIARFGPVDFFHYDLNAQALAKIERGHDRDLADVRAMIERGLVTPTALKKHFEAVRPDLLRYPAIDPEVFEKRLERFLAEGHHD